MEQQIRALAYGRIALGVVLLAAPRPLLRLWFGDGAGNAMAGVMARSAGGRDVALGLGTLLALRHGAPVRGWIEATALSDAADAVALAIGAKDLPRFRALAPILPTVATVGFERMLVSKVAAGSTDAAAMP